MNSPIDMDALREIMDDDDELIKDCFTDFVEDCDEMLALIQTAIDADNAIELEKSAHALKGSLIYLAATEAADFAYRLESMGQKKNLTGAKVEFESLSKACSNLVAYMKSY